MGCCWGHGQWKTGGEITGYGGQFDTAALGFRQAQGDITRVGAELHTSPVGEAAVEIHVGIHRFHEQSRNPFTVDSHIAAGGVHLDITACAADADVPTDGGDAHGRRCARDGDIARHGFHDDASAHAGELQGATLCGHFHITRKFLTSTSAERVFTTSRTPRGTSTSKVHRHCDCATSC